MLQFSKETENKVQELLAVSCKCLYERRCAKREMIEGNLLDVLEVR